MFDQITHSANVQRLFLADQYADCIQEIQRAMALLGSAQLPEIYILVLCLGRVGTADSIESVRGRVRPWIEGFPFQLALLDLVCNKTDLESVLRFATSDEQRGEAYFYAGEVALTNRELGFAIDFFVACVKIGVSDCFSKMARVEGAKARAQMLAWFRGQIGIRVAALTSASRDGCHKRADIPMSLAKLATEVLETLEGDGSDSTIASGLRLIVADDYAAAIPMLELGVQTVKSSSRPHDPLLDAADRILSLARLAVSDHVTAIASLETLAENAKAQFGNTASQFADAIQDLAAAHIGINNLETAQSLLNDAQQIRENKGYTHDLAYSVGRWMLLNTKLAQIAAYSLPYEREFKEGQHSIYKALRAGGEFSMSAPTRDFQIAVQDAVQQAAAECDDPFVALLHYHQVCMVVHAGDDLESAFLMTTAMREVIDQNVISWNLLDVMNASLLGLLYLRRGEYRRAYELLSPILRGERVDPGLTIRDHLDIRLRFAWACCGADRSSEAIPVLEGALRYHYFFFRSVALRGPSRSRAISIRILRRYTASLLTLVSTYLREYDQSGPLVFQILHLGKGLEAQIEQVVKKAVRSASTGLQADWQAVRDRIQTLEMDGPRTAAIQESKRGEALTRYRQKLHGLYSEKDAIERAGFRALSSLDWILPPTLVSFQRSFSPQTLFIEFARYPHSMPTDFDTGKEAPRSEYVAVVVGGATDAIPRYIYLGDSRYIDRLVAEFRAALLGESLVTPWHKLAMPVVSFKAKNPDRLDFFGLEDLDAKPAGIPKFLQTGFALRKTIIDPLLRFVGGCTHIAISVDGDISLVPFEVLPADDDMLLADHYNIEYVSGIGRLVRSDSGDRSVGPCVVAGAAAYDYPEDLIGDAGVAPFPPLDGAEAEAVRIAALLNVDAWLGRTVTKSRVHSVTRPDILHLATHAFYLDNPLYDLSELSPWMDITVGAEDCRAGRREGLRLRNAFYRSGLALSGANVWFKFGELPKELGNGLLTADDILSMDLDGTNLVVLSACDSGVGEVKSLEGVIGLRQAFEIAGVRNLIVSLWRVPDDATQELFVLMYQYMINGLKEPSEALRAAKQEMIRRGRKMSIWSAFVCQAA